MKKLYSLFFIVFVSSWSFGQILSDNFNYADNALLTDNGWTAHSGTGTNPVEVGASNGLVYTGYNTVAGNAAVLDNTGEDVNKPFATEVTSGDLYLSFLVKVTAVEAGYFIHLGKNTSYAARVYVKASATAGKINFGLSNTSTASYSSTPTDYDLDTTYLIIVKYNVSSNGSSSMWVRSTGIPATEVSAGTPEHTATGSGQSAIAGVYLRQYANLTTPVQNMTIDEIKVYTTWFGATPCDLVLGTAATTCTTTTLNIDNYSVNIPFTGGGTGTYTLSTNHGTISGANPSTSTEGDIIISGITEGVDVTLTVTGGCSLTKLVTAPQCKPINTLPYAESFPYADGSSLNDTQKWTSANSGDNVTIAAGNLNYAGFTSTGNSITFSGAGAESFTPFTATTSGTIYASFIMNVTDMANTGDPSVTYFAGLSDGTTGGYNARIFLNRVGTQYQLGFDTASSTTNYDATMRNVGDIVFVVMGYDFTSNTYKAWINPSLGTFTDASPATLTVTPTTAPTTFGGFLIRQESTATTPTIVMDELRVATTTSVLLSVSQNAIAGLKVYPNPVPNGRLFIETAANAERTVAIYDLLGKNVLNTTTSNSEINVASLNAGVYIVKITEEGNTTSRKLIIR
ncbi:MAG: T9SS type A sorting domain-containing protein [Bacteroidetes bacterium]|uniref:T9SS type A sorting domain-containing protein n=1 Tax=Flavobacterium sp. TaxID=239 RepID=UPI002FD9D67F|nr:T9SS type A sorting domain-containing protein [Bacteroidota bacterium]